MTLNDYMGLSKLLCEELNVHKRIQKIADTEKGELLLVFYTPLDIESPVLLTKKDELYLTLGGKKINKPTLLDKIVEKL
jgi:hypothetical protein